MKENIRRIRSMGMVYLVGATAASTQDIGPMVCSMGPAFIINPKTKRQNTASGKTAKS